MFKIEISIKNGRNTATLLSLEAVLQFLVEILTLAGLKVHGMVYDETLVNEISEESLRKANPDAFKNSLAEE